MACRRVAVGGLGGGGDSGGALALAIPLKLRGVETVFIAFGNCRVSAVLNAEKISSAVLRVTGESWSGGRFFEPHIASLGFETYLVCTRELGRTVISGFLELLEDLGVSLYIGVDLGGDSLMFGDEPLLGSYITDMLSLAALSEALEKLGLTTLLGVGAIGLEGGGEMLSPSHLAENLMHLYSSGAYIGCYRPPPSTLPKVLNAISILLEREKSAMLTLYRDALSGKLGFRRYDVAYLHKVVEILNYHGDIYMFNAHTVCEASNLCRAARRGWLPELKRAAGFRKVRKRPKDTALNKVLELLRKRKAPLDKIIKTIKSRK